MPLCLCRGRGLLQFTMWLPSLNEPKKLASLCNRLVEVQCKTKNSVVSGNRTHIFHWHVMFQNLLTTPPLISTSDLMLFTFDATNNLKLSISGDGLALLRHKSCSGRCRKEVGNSVTRVVDFWKFLTTNLQIKVAKKDWRLFGLFWIKITAGINWCGCYVGNF